MAFESVNVDSLRSALDSCKNSIKHDTTDNLIGQVGNSSVWQCDAQNTLKDGLSRLVSTGYNDLENKINSYYPVVSLIQKYKDLEAENERLKSEKAALIPKLYKTEHYTFLGMTFSRKVVDQSVANRISEIVRKINENKAEMDSIEQQVAGMV